MTVERIHPKAPVMKLIFIAIFTCLPSCINLSNIDQICVEVFEQTISRTEMIDHSFERKFYGAWNMLKVSARVWTRTTPAQSFQIAVLL